MKINKNKSYDGAKGMVLVWLAKCKGGLTMSKQIINSVHFSVNQKEYEKKYLEHVETSGFEIIDNQYDYFVLKPNMQYLYNENKGEMVARHINLDDKCPDCGVKNGEYHYFGCDWERDPMNGQQLITSDNEYCLVDLTEEK